MEFIFIVAAFAMGYTAGRYHARRIGGKSGVQGGGGPGEERAKIQGGGGPGEEGP